jgi:hypothetical protein
VIATVARSSRESRVESMLDWLAGENKRVLPITPDYVKE